MAAALIIAVSLMLMPALPTSASGSDVGKNFVLADYSKDKGDLQWYVVNDNVMGGRSEGDFEIEQGGLRFAGRTNTRGGGFSSIRSRPVQLNLSKYEGIQLQVRADGRRYTWRVTTDARWRGRQISYWANFDTSDNAWTTVEIPFSRFVPRFRGARLDGPELDPAKITSMGLMIYDNLDGPFELRLASVAAYSERTPFALKHFRWKNRVLVVSAAAGDDANLLELQGDLASMSEEFEDRDMVLVTLLDTGASIAGERTIDAADADATRTRLGMSPGSFALRLVGKDGSVKLSAEAAVPMTEIFALIDTMPMRQREKASR